MGAEELAGAVGARVRQARAARGWTLDELAERSGVSRRMLINVEQGVSNASIATLLRLGDALGVGLPALVDVEPPGSLRVVAADDTPVLWRGPHGGQARLAAGTQPPHVVELWHWTLAAGESYRSDSHASGTRELLLVLDGALRLNVGPDERVLDVGEAAQFAGDVPHSYGHAGTTQDPVRFALTVYEPLRGPHRAPGSASA